MPRPVTRQGKKTTVHVIDVRTGQEQKRADNRQSLLLKTEICHH